MLQLVAALEFGVLVFGALQNDLRVVRVALAPILLHCSEYILWWQL